MIVYTSKGDGLFDTKNKDVYKEGTSGKIYLDGNYCHKIFNNPKEFTEKPFIILRELDLPNFYKILDYLYNDRVKFIGYTSNFIKEDDINILEDRDYLVRGFNNIFNGIKAFSKENIEVVDLHPLNILMSKKDMFVTDIDYFKRVNNDPTNINIFRYKQLIKNLVYEYLKKYDVKDIMGAYQLILDLIDINSPNLKHFNKIMRKVNKPIDYFNKVIK